MSIPGVAATSRGTGIAMPFPLLVLEDLLGRLVVQIPPLFRSHRDAHYVVHLTIVFQNMEVLVPDVFQSLRHIHLVVFRRDPVAA